MNNVTSTMQIPPHALDGEESVLAACLMSPTAIGAVAEVLTPDDFYRTGNGHIYQTIIDLYGGGKDVDAVTLTAELKNRSILDTVGGRDYIFSLPDFPAVASNARQYADIVKAASLRRSIIRAGQQIEELGNAEGEADSLLEKAEEIIYGIRQNHRESEGVEVRDLIPATQKYIEDARKGIKACGYSTTFLSIDDIVGGFAPGTLIILGARPSTGKTALAVNILQRMATEHYVALFSLEMSRHEIMQRMICSMARVPLTKLRAGAITDDEEAKLLSATYRAGDLQFHIDDGDLSMTSLRSKVRRLSMRHKLGLIAVDYIQLMSSERRRESRNYELAEISRGMKQLAREFDVPVLCLSQLSRPDNGEKNPRPKLSDLRDSGALEQDADQVLFLYRSESQNAGDRVTLIVGKNRNGATGEVDLRFEAKYTRFSDRV